MQLLILNPICRYLLRRSIQTRPALGPTEKILESRKNAFVTREKEQITIAQREYVQFRGWLKALYPLAKTIKSLPKIEPVEEDARKITENAQFNKKLRHCTEFFINNDMAPSERVLIALCANASSVELLQVAIRVLRTAQFKGAVLEDSISAAFVRSAAKICIEECRDIVKFDLLMGEALAEKPYVAICVGPKTVLALNDALSAAITDGMSQDGQKFAFTLVLTAAKYARLWRQEIKAVSDDSMKAEDSLLRLLLKADGLTGLDGVEELTLESPPITFPDWILSKIEIVGALCARNRDSTIPADVIPSLAETFLKRKMPVPSWVPLDSQAEHCRAYRAASEFLKTSVRAPLASVMAEVEASDNALTQRAILFINNSLAASAAK